MLKTDCPLRVGSWSFLSVYHTRSALREAQDYLRRTVESSSQRLGDKSLVIILWKFRLLAMINYHLTVGHWLYFSVFLSCQWQMKCYTHTHIVCSHILRGMSTFCVCDSNVSVVLCYFADSLQQTWNSASQVTFLWKKHVNRWRSSRWNESVQDVDKSRWIIVANFSYYIYSLSQNSWNQDVHTQMFQESSSCPVCSTHISSAVYGSVCAQWADGTVCSVAWKTTRG